MKNTPKKSWRNLLVPEGTGNNVAASLSKLCPKGLPAPLPPIVIRASDLQLKKLKIHPDMSEETTAFSAEVWRGGRLIGYAKNDGRGGETSIQQSERSVMVEAEDWARSLPPESSYQRIYESLIFLDDSYFAGLTMRGVNEQWWATTSRVDLHQLVDSMVSRELAHKSVRKVKATVIVGPTINQPHESPLVLIYKKIPTDAQAAIDKAALAKKCTWSYTLRDALDLPYHYYPAPHEFSSGWPKQRVTVDCREGEVGYGATRDDQVEVAFGDDEWAVFSPASVQLVSNAEVSAAACS